MPRLKQQGRKLCVQNRKLVCGCGGTEPTGPCCALGHGCSIQVNNGAYAVTAVVNIAGTASMGAYSGSPSVPAHSVNFQYNWPGSSSGTFTNAACLLELSNGSTIGAGVQATAFGTNVGPAGATGSITPSVPFYSGGAPGPNSFFAAIPSSLDLNVRYVSEITILPDFWVTSSGIPVSVYTSWQARVTVAADGTISVVPLLSYTGASTLGIDVSPISNGSCITGFDFTIQGSVKLASAPSSWPVTQIAASGRVAFLTGIDGCSTPQPTTATCETVTVDGYFLTANPAPAPMLPPIEPTDDPINGAGFLLP